eukprot:TRINITY_DN66467_c10_g1_i1.p3 TRINITY_DN66467_c10_g1~~TRINITY_DN66467_c10_g1_i1.p3  ORF type:complete len:150 (-),score=59.98 TRINITY_DN66467_c10_g1_i1:140-589(-)
MSAASKQQQEDQKPDQQQQDQQQQDQKQQQKDQQQQQRDIEELQQVVPGKWHVAPQPKFKVKWVDLDEVEATEAFKVAMRSRPYARADVFSCPHCHVGSAYMVVDGTRNNQSNYVYFCPVCDEPVPLLQYVWFFAPAAYRVRDGGDDDH